MREWSHRYTNRNSLEVPGQAERLEFERQSEHGSREVAIGASAVQGRLHGAHQAARAEGPAAIPPRQDTCRSEFRRVYDDNF